MPSFNHFDFLAPYYDRFIKPNDPARFGVLAGLPVNGLLLDVGGGTGQKTSQLLGMAAGIVIADSSMGMLSQASQRRGLVTICTQSEQMPFQDGSFERVIMIDALHHVADYRRTIREMWRVVKPGGRIIIEEPDIRTSAVKIMAIIEKLTLMRSQFIDPLKIAEEFADFNGRVNIEVEASTAWIMIDKLAAQPKGVTR
jgi:2-polyprenyl-3-methyl-5-hydroxy-6-metoxy-1,4-benzoquinol methylase